MEEESDVEDERPVSTSTKADASKAVDNPGTDLSNVNDHHPDAINYDEGCSILDSIVNFDIFRVMMGAGISEEVVEKNSNNLKRGEKMEILAENDILELPMVEIHSRDPNKPELPEDLDTTSEPTIIEYTTLESEPTTLENTTLELEPTTLENTNLEPATLENTALELEPTTLENATLELEPTTVENNEMHMDKKMIEKEIIKDGPISTVSTMDIPAIPNPPMKIDPRKITLQREVHLQDVEILHLHEENKARIGSRSNSDIQLWLDNQSQYSFIMQKSLRPLTTQLSNVGVKTQGYIGRFAYLTDEILSKLCDTTGEILKSGKIFTRRVWSSWYPEHNLLTTVEAWQLILLEVIYRLDPPSKERRKCEQFVKQELKLQEKQYNMLADLCDTIVEKSYRARQIIRKIKTSVKHKFENCNALVPPSLRKHMNEGIKYQSAIPLKQRKPQYRGVKVVPLLKKNDYIFKCGERGLLIKKVLGLEVHFGSLEYSSKQEFFRMCLYEVLSLSHKSEKKLQNALVNLSFESPVGNTYGKKSVMQRYCEEMRTIVKNKANIFWPAIKVLVNGQIERIETEIKAVIEAGNNTSIFFKNQSYTLRSMRKNFDAVKKGTYQKKHKMEIISHLKEFHMKISTFPFNISAVSLLHQNYNLALTQDPLSESEKHNTVVFIESQFSGININNEKLRNSIKVSAEEFHTVYGASNDQEEKDADICILVENFEDLLLNEPIKHSVDYPSSPNIIEIPTGNESSGSPSPRIEVHDIRQCSEYVKRFYFACSAITNNFEKCKQNLESVMSALFSKSLISVRIDRGKPFVNCTAWLWIVARAVKSLQIDEEQYINARYRNATPSSKQSQSSSKSVEKQSASKNLKRSIEQELLTFLSVLLDMDNCMKNLKRGREKMIKIVKKINEKNVLFFSPSGRPNVTTINIPGSDKSNVTQATRKKDIIVSVKPEGILFEYLGKDVIYERCKPEIRVRLFHMLFQSIIGQFDTQCDGLREIVGCLGKRKKNKSSKIKSHQDNGLIPRLQTIDKLLSKLYKKKSTMTYNEEQMILKSYEKVENDVHIFNGYLQTIDKRTAEVISEVNVLRKPLMTLLEIRSDKRIKLQSFNIKKIKLHRNPKPSELSLECFPEMFCWFSVNFCNDSMFQRNLESLFVSEGLLPTKVKSKKKKANKTHSM